MINNKAILIILILSLSILLVFTPAIMAQDEEDQDLEKRLELIQASQSLLEEKREVTPNLHKLATIFTTYGDGNSIINSGLRVAPELASPGNMALRFMGEVFYLRQNEDLAAFLSLAIEPIPSLYFGGGAEVTETADYQVFTGWNITENIFIEARAINSGSDFSESDIEPVAGFQFSF